MRLTRSILAILALSFCATLMADSADIPLEESTGFAETRAFIRQAEECLAQEEFKKAAKFFRKAALLQDDYAQKAGFYYREAQALVQARKLQDAKRAYKRLLGEFLCEIPLDSVFTDLRGLAELFEMGDGTVFSLKDPTTAIEIYRMIIQYENSIQASRKDRLVLAEKLMADQQPAEAIKVYQQILKLLPDDADTRFLLAKILGETAAQGDSDGVLSRATMREIRRVVELLPQDDPRQAEAREILSACRNREGNRLLERASFYLVEYHYKPDVARRYLLDLRKEYPDTPAGEKARAILEEKFPENSDL